MTKLLLCTVTATNAVLAKVRRGPGYYKTDLGGFYAAIGTRGNQYKNGPMVGLLMAERIEACEKGHYHDADPVRVTCPITGNVLNAGFYSRNREINEDSSFSVLG